MVANNPFEFKRESKMTRAERIESVASICYQQWKNAEDVTNEFLFRFFPTYGSDTIMSGIKMFNEYLAKYYKESI